MINFRVVRLRDIFKGLVKVGVLAFGIVLFTSLFNSARKVNLNQFVENRKKDLKGRTFIEILKENLDNDSIKDDIEKQNLISGELDGVVAAFVPVGEKNTDEIIDMDAIFEENGENTEEVIANDESIPTSVETRVVSEHNLSNVFNTSFRKCSN